MKTFLSLILCRRLLHRFRCAGAGRAGPTRGKVLVLENEQTLTGDVEKIGDVYHIRRLIGETAVPADQVLRLCGDMAEAYAFVRGRANLADPDEHLRLAEWCRLNGLHDQAIAEVQAAVDLRPDHEPSRRLLAYLQETRPGQPAAPAHGDVPADGPKLSVDLTEDALGQFATKVQPILMNACANCHANGRGGAFKLTRTYDSVVLNRKTMQQNLAAVLGEVNPGQPQNSPLLCKAVSVHGPLESAPLKNRQAAAYRTLEEWVKNTLADNPQLLDPSPVRPAAATAPPAAAAPPPAEVRPTAFSNQTTPGKVETPPAPAAAPQPADPVQPRWVQPSIPRRQVPEWSGAETVTPRRPTP